MGGAGSGNLVARWQLKKEVANSVLRRNRMSKRRLRFHSRPKWQLADWPRILQMVGFIRILRTWVSGLAAPRTSNEANDRRGAF
jgi:hypothetical protein